MRFSARRGLVTAAEGAAERMYEHPAPDPLVRVDLPPPESV